MDKKCEELLDDSVINTRYPNKQKLIIKYLHFFSTVINTRVENFIKTFVEKCGKVWRNRVDVGDYSPSTSHCTVRTGLVYGATYI